MIGFTSFTHFLLFFPHQVLNADPYGIAMTQDHPLHEYLRGHSLNVIRDTTTRKQMLQTWKLEDKEETLGQGDDDSSKVQALFWQYYGYAMLILVRLWLEYISMDIYIHVHIRAYPQAHVKRKQTQTCLHEISFGIQVHARARAHTHTHTQMGLLVAWYLAFRSLRDKIKTENIDSELAASDGVDYMEEEAALLCSSQVMRHYLFIHAFLLVSLLCSSIHA